MSQPFPSPTLSDGELRLRGLTDGDLDELAGAVGRPGVREWWGTARDPKATREDLRNGGRAFAIEVDGSLAGWLGFDEETDPDYRHASLDIFLCPSFQGGGRGPAALTLAARWLIEERGHHRLTIDPACANRRAISAYSAVGFRRVGVMRRYERGVDGDWHDNLLMDMLAEELRD